jgi:hypothetical protein
MIFDFYNSILYSTGHLIIPKAERKQVGEQREEPMPKAVDDVTLAFPANVEELMPEMVDIPVAFHCGGHTWGNLLFNAWFFRGLTSLDIVAKPGIDKEMALRHIKAIMRSFQPNHEHKEAACAYLFDLWFEPATWESKG